MTAHLTLRTWVLPRAHLDEGGRAQHGLLKDGGEVPEAEVPEAAVPEAAVPEAADLVAV